MGVWAQNIRRQNPFCPGQSDSNRGLPGRRAASLDVTISHMSRFAAALFALVCASALAQVPAAAPDKAFERDLFKTRFEHEVAFRGAAIEVAWASEKVCDTTIEIEPFVLLSVHSLRQSLSDSHMAIFRQVTGMDEKWRVVWLDEGAPDEMKLGQAVVAVNDRPLTGGNTKIEMSAWFSGRSIVSRDDRGLWDVILAARKEATEGKPMVVTLEDGRKLTVDTQTGCAGSVTASSFDADPDVFWRQGNTRAKIPANAMLEARTKDEFRWLAAFGTYFQASERAIQRVKQADNMSNGFVVGKVLMMAVPGAGMLLSAAEAQAEKALTVDSIVGDADLFANEVVTAMGGDPGAGLRLSERMLALQMKVDAVLMDDFRRSNAVEHVRRLRALRVAQAEREKAEALAQEEAQKAPLKPR